MKRVLAAMLLITLSVTKSHGYDLELLLAEDRVDEPSEAPVAREFVDQARNQVNKAHQEYDSRYSPPAKSSSLTGTVFIDAECVGWPCVADNFQISGGPADIEMSAGIAYLNDVGEGVRGKYRFSARLSPSDKLCSGTFEVRATRKNARLNIYENCDSYLSEF
ncbi:hypothetical protein C7H09_14485 [Marinobacter fuscus]|uniref:Uncharacterized protein n=1 Tax=Marinobacter fuscus TaxID=2109942 RepID=A0A2T1K5Y0_9GAMM|nr:hypothetical protein [Marinobacter fuscus]PSF05507.1 hypothetical protein C7H09_14485 [Marinobacter fuscus]